MGEENSISIINRTNGQLTGEKAQALPIKIIANLSWVKVFIIGFILAIILMCIFIFTIKKSVVVVQVVGTSPDYQEYQVK